MLKTPGLLAPTSVLFATPSGDPGEEEVLQVWSGLPTLEEEILPHPTLSEEHELWSQTDCMQIPGPLLINRITSSEMQITVIMLFIDELNELIRIRCLERAWYVVSAQ